MLRYNASSKEPPPGVSGLTPTEIGSPFLYIFEAPVPARTTTVVSMLTKKFFSNILLIQLCVLFLVLRRLLHRSRSWLKVRRPTRCIGIWDHEIRTLTTIRKVRGIFIGFFKFTGTRNRATPGCQGLTRDYQQFPCVRGSDANSRIRDQVYASKGDSTG